ncbi:MAG: arylesterase [Acidobacteria bacterium]|nr:arylesterase [Acidobacteriota bacterium]
MRLVMTGLVVGLLATAACGGSGDPAGRSHPDEAPATVQRSPGQPADAPSAARPRIVFLGDSLTAGLGLAADASYPALLQQRLDAEGYRYDVVNAGVSGDTSAGGVRRLEWSLEGDVRILVVALGANDGLRGLPPNEMRKNLSAILGRAQAQGITIILTGMEAPPNYGAEYTRQFREVYTDLAREYRVRLLPFLLQGVAGVATLNQADGIHPNTRGARIVADSVWEALKPELERSTAVSS